MDVKIRTDLFDRHHVSDAHGKKHRNPVVNIRQKEDSRIAVPSELSGRARGCLRPDQGPDSLAGIKKILPWYQAAG